MNNVANWSSASSCRIGLALLAFAAASCSADDTHDPQRVASPMERMPAMSAESRNASDCAASQSPTTSIRLESPRGEALQLSHFADCGWKYIDANRSGAPQTALAAVAYHPSSARQSADSVKSEDPTTVFIDGPTGYVFAWTPEGRWNFVGQLLP